MSTQHKRPSKRSRITPMQQEFLIALFVKGLDFHEAARQCDVRVRQLQRWLKEPRFQEAFRRQLEVYNFAARFEAVRSLPEITRNLVISSNAGSEQISYAASRALLRAGYWLRRSLDPFADYDHTGKLPETPEALERLVGACLTPPDTREKECA